MLKFKCLQQSHTQTHSNVEKNITKRNFGLIGLASAPQWTCVCQSEHQLKTFLSSTTSGKVLKTCCTKAQCWRKETTCCGSRRGTYFACPSGISFVSPRGICFDCQSEQKRQDMFSYTLNLILYLLFLVVFPPFSIILSRTQTEICV